jgi:hypothetical protein
LAKKSICLEETLLNNLVELVEEDGGQNRRIDGGGIQKTEFFVKSTNKLLEGVLLKENRLDSLEEKVFTSI